MESTYLTTHKLPLINFGIVDRQAILHNVYNNFINTNQTLEIIPSTFINSINSKVFNLNDTFYYLLRSDLRLCKFLIEDVFGYFSENNWLYFTVLPENYKLFICKFNLLSNWVVSDNNAGGYSHSSVWGKINQITSFNSSGEANYSRVTKKIL